MNVHPHVQRTFPPYPARLASLPGRALPGSGRRRNVSVWRVFYLGRHPVALLISVCFVMIPVVIVTAWCALVGVVWALWALAVTGVWLCQLAAARMRR